MSRNDNLSIYDGIQCSPRFPRQIRVGAALVGAGLLLLVAKRLVVLGQEVGVLL